MYAFAIRRLVSVIFNVHEIFSFNFRLTLVVFFLHGENIMVYSEKFKLLKFLQILRAFGLFELLRLNFTVKVKGVQTNILPGMFQQVLLCADRKSVV